MSMNSVSNATISLVNHDSLRESIGRKKVTRKVTGLFVQDNATYGWVKLAGNSIEVFRRKHSRVWMPV